MPNILQSILFDRTRFRVLILLVSLISSIGGILTPLCQKEFIDVLMGKTTWTFLHWISEIHPLVQPLSPLIPLVLAFVFSIVSMVLYQWAFYLANIESLKMQQILSEKMYQKILELSTDSLTKKSIGETVGIFATDIAAATILLEQTLPQICLILFPLILTPLSLYWFFHLPLGNILWAILPIVLINGFLGIRQSKFFYKFKFLAQERIGLVNEWIQHIRTLRILGWVEQFEKKIFAKREQETANRLTMVTNGQLMNSVGSSATWIVNIAAIYTLTHSRQVTPGELLSLVWIIGVFLTRPFRQMPWFFVFLIDGFSSIKRLEYFFSTQNRNNRLSPLSPPVQPHPTLPFPFDLNSAFAIEVQNLTLVYDSQIVLNEISFRIKRGQFVALIGEVGSGKSSILNALLVENGGTFSKYNLFGTKTKHITDDQIRSVFSFVPQEGFVVSATLRDNVALDYQVTPAEHDAAINKALISSQLDLEKDQKTLDTEIGERGVNLSGGQKQRVSIARAAWFDRPIILLDDCLSALDIDTEKKILASLFLGAWKDKTRVLVTHRLSVLPFVDHIFFIQKGRIIAQGNFDELNSNEEFRNFLLVPNLENTLISQEGL